MKHLLLAALLATAAPALAQTAPAPTEQQAGTTDALDAKNGFRNFKFGTPIADIPNLIKRDGGLYGAPKESMLIGDIKLSSIRLAAHNGKLTGVILKTATEKYAQQLLEVLTLQYGEPQSIGLNEKAWNGKVVSMIYKTESTYIGYGVSAIRVTVYMASNEYLNDIVAEKKAAAKKAADDL